MDRTVIVTGANSGIGLAASQELARHDVSLVMACRDLERGEAALRKVRDASGNEGVRLEQLDTSSIQSVQEFAARIVSQTSVVHALINNAGAFDISQREATLTEDGFESIWATNYLGPWLLTRLLMDRLSAAVPGRVIDVSSKGLIAHPFMKVDVDAAARGENFSPERAYYQSKLQALTSSFRLGRTTNQDDVVVHAVWVPAVKVATDRIPELPAITRWVYMQKRKLALEPEEMARTYVSLALDEAWGQRTACLVDHEQRVVRPPKRALDMAVARELDERTRALVIEAGADLP